MAPYSPESISEKAQEYPVLISSEQSELLSHYFSLLERANKRVNLTSVPPKNYLSHHLSDVFFLAIQPEFEKSLHLVDLGSGGGVPALPLAVLFPEIQITCIESRARKADFLNYAAVQLKLKRVRVVNSRIEDAAVGSLPECDLVTARALAPLPELLAISRALCSEASKLLFLKGRNWSQEVKPLSPAIRYEMRSHPLESEEGVILAFSGSQLLQETAPPSAQSKAAG